MLRLREHVREMYGGEPGVTSNNRMELMAPIMALEALTRPVVVHLHTDSTYVRNGITKWVLGWQRNGWLTAAKQPVKNVDLWQRLQAACARARGRVVLGEGALRYRRQRVGRRAGDARYGRGDRRGQSRRLVSCPKIAGRRRRRSRGAETPRRARNSDRSSAAHRAVDAPCPPSGCCAPSDRCPRWRPGRDG